MRLPDRIWHPLKPHRDEVPAESLFLCRPPYRTLLRWAYIGLCNGKVKLRLTKSGGRVGVLREDAEAFELALERERAGPVTVPNVREQRRQAKRSDKYLESIGLGQ